jgi:4-diphosphocytidyl-2-C-methyl-D-erythritol kinase
VKIETPAKVNLSLRVHSIDATGYHPLSSLVQAIEPFDSLSAELAPEDSLDVEGVRVPDGDENLVWQAVRAALPERNRGVHVKLTKRIPTAAGLGGGSSDAAAALLAVEQLFGVGLDPSLAAGVGADVPFFLTGGLATMEGYGELITPLGGEAGFHLALVVPPFDLPTPTVYGLWDRLGEPSGFDVAGLDLPPSLRSAGPLANDLYPAAIALAPDLDDWRAELASRWGRPVLMSGSGPSLFAFFSAEEEAREAQGLTPAGSRYSSAVASVDHGARLVDDG